MATAKSDLIGKSIEQRIDGGAWFFWGVVRNEEEAVAIAERIKMGSHAILGGQHTTEYKVSETV